MRLLTQTACIMTCALLLAHRAGAQTPARCAELATDVEKELRAELSHFFPAVVDSQGGFFVNFSVDWRRLPETERTTVSQGRLAWTAAEVSRRRTDLHDTYAGYAAHGAKYLRDVMWDKQHGGFYWSVDPQNGGAPKDHGEKHLYGNAFGIYGAAAAYRVTRDESTLDLAKRAFNWIERYGHDDQHGGYFEAFSRDGTPLLKRPAIDKSMDQLGTLYGFKSMNAHLHLLEAYTELYRVWQEPKLKARIAELLDILKNKMYVEPGCLHMQYTRDWRPLPAPDSYGHDIETTFLMDEAQEAIGQHDPVLTAIGKQLADHALEIGWDAQHGGLYFEGAAYGPATDTRKEWWVQAETANTLLLLAQKTGDRNYMTKFEMQWKFITDYQIDKKNGGWYQATNASGEPINRSKIHVWKLTYHNCRAMLNIADRLRAMAR